MEEFGLTGNGALLHLKCMMAEMILFERRCTHPRGSGPVTYWSVNRSEVESLIESLVDYLFCADE